MRKSSGLAGGRKYNPRCPSEKEAERELTGRRGEGHRTTEARCWPAGSETEEGARTRGMPGAQLERLEKEQTLSLEPRRKCDTLTSAS